MYDYLLKNGTVVDGTGKTKAYRMDVAICDGKIVEIGANIEGEAAKVLDCTGYVVSPGFIDAHSHSDCHILSGSDGYNKLEQGITTEVTGHCGEGSAVSYDGLQEMEDYKKINSPSRFAEIKAACDSFGAFLDAVEHEKIGPNMAFFAGQGNIRGRVMGFDSSVPNKEQMDAMKLLLKEAMESGYLGYSTGLVYPPSVYAKIDELAELAKVMVPYGGIYSSHIRGEGGTVFPAVEEALAIGHKAGVPVTVSHLKIMGKEHAGRASELLQMLEKANASGDVARTDQYPYTAGSAPLISQLPPKFMEKGPVALLEALGEKSVREEIEYSIFHPSGDFEGNILSAGWGGCLIAEANKTPEAVGKTLEELGTEMHQSPMDVCAWLLRENEASVRGIYFSQNEEDMMTILSHKLVCGGTDWSSPVEHIDPEKKGGGHPRGFASMPRRLQLLREQGKVSLEEAVESITGRAAITCNIADKVGTLAEGRSADICVFSWESIRTNSDYLHPFRRSDGIRYVFVNGVLAVDGGVHTGARAGKVLRRK